MNTSSSFIQIAMKDGKTFHSHHHPNEASWHRHAHKMRVRRGDQYKTVYASHTNIKSITVHHEGVEKTIDIPPGCLVFQSIVAQTTASGKDYRTKVLGRIAGIIKGDEVIEEYFLDGESRNILGYKYKEHHHGISSGS